MYDEVCMNSAVLLCRKGGELLFAADGRRVFDVGPELACDMMNRDPNIPAQKKGGKKK